MRKISIASAIYVYFGALLSIVAGQIEKGTLYEKDRIGRGLGRQGWGLGTYTVVYGNIRSKGKHKSRNKILLHIRKYEKYETTFIHSTSRLPFNIIKV